MPGLSVTLNTRVARPDEMRRHETRRNRSRRGRKKDDALVKQDCFGNGSGDVEAQANNPCADSRQFCTCGWWRTVATGGKLVELVGFFVYLMETGVFVIVFVVCGFVESKKKNKMEYFWRSKMDWW